MGSESPNSTKNLMQVNPKQPAIAQKTGPDLSQKGASQNEVAQTRVQLGKKKMPPDPAMNNIMQADSHDVTMTLRRTYGDGDFKL